MIELTSLVSQALSWLMQNEAYADFELLIQLLKQQHGVPACWPHVDQARHLSEDELQRLIDELTSDDEH
jgi:hypothetical protein